MMQVALLCAVLCCQEEEEAEDDDDAHTAARSLRDSIASMKWLREREGTGWSGGTAADPIKQQQLQQVASIKRCAACAVHTRLLV